MSKMYPYDAFETKADAKKMQKMLKPANSLFNMNMLNRIFFVSL